jgi:hypothetical protein
VWENAWNVLFLGLILLGYEYVNRKKEYGWILLITGTVAGFYAYHPGKLFIIPFMTILFMYIFKSKEDYVKRLLTCIFVICCFVVLISPQAVSMMKNPGVAFGRINTVSITQEENIKEYFTTSLKNNINGLLLFSASASYIGLNSRYVPSGKPFISRVFFPFLIIGIIYALIHKKFYIWTFFILLFPVQLLSRGTPDTSRGVHVIGMYYLLIGMGIMWVISKGTLLIRHVKTKHKRLIHIGITIIFVCSIWYVVFQDLNTYTSWITSKQALEAREPAVWRGEYEAWRDTLKESIKSGKGGFNVYDWKHMTGRE